MCVFLYYKLEWSLLFYVPSAAVCSPSCSNGGTCVSPNVCRCSNGHTGPLCTIRKFYIFSFAGIMWLIYVVITNMSTLWGFFTAVCNPPCLNGGTCGPSHTCSCVPYKYTGSQCEIRKLVKKRNSTRGELAQEKHSRKPIFWNILIFIMTMAIKSTPKEKKQNKIKWPQGKIAHPRIDPCIKQAWEKYHYA